MAIDPITFAVVKNRLVGAANDMNSVFRRTTMLPVLYEYNDSAMGLYDKDLNLLAEAPGLPIFCGSLDTTIKGSIERIGGPENLEEGDILVNSDPFLTGAQPVDVALFHPIFLDGEIAAYAALRAHMGDTGAKGPYPSDSTEVYQEGLIVPAIKLYKAGVLNEDLIEMIKSNSRMPAETAGNVFASAGALRHGAEKLLRVIESHGREVYEEVVSELLDHGERMARQGIAEIPDGVYEAEDFLDDNGVDLDDPVRLHLKLTIDGDEVIMDLSGSAPVQRGAVNCPLPYTLSSCRFSLKRLVTPGISANGGEARPMTVIAPEGSVFNPQWPAPSFVGWVAALRLSDMIIKAVSEAIPDRVPADNGGDLTVILGYLTDPKTNRLSFFWDDGGVGQGAIKGADGVSAQIHAMSAGVEYLPAELLETRMPIRRLRHEFEADTGGPGEFRGGLGSITEYEMLGSGIADFVCDKTKDDAVKGIFGGGPASRGNAIRVYADTDKERVVGKRSGFPIEPGDLVVSMPTGGGGYGDPFQRDPRKVVDDVADGYVTRGAAESAYGVVLNDDGTLDEKATSEARSRKS